MISLLLILWIQFYILIPSIFTQFDNDWRLRVIASTAFSGCCLVLVTEGLSLLQLLKHNVLVFTWFGIIFIVAGVILIRRKKTKGIRLDLRKINRLTWFEISILCVICILALIMGVIAYVAAPNNADSMLYHLTRVAHWQQDHSVVFFPANNLKQLVFSPFAEYVLLHFHLLTGADQFDNLLQWWAMLLSLVGASYLAKRLGAPRSVQIFSALFVITLPMGVFQSATTQNDYVLSAWVVSLACFGFAYFENQNIYPALIFGILLSLAVFTKATAYIFCPVIVLGLVYVVRKKIFFKRIAHMVFVLFLVICLNLPFWLRNYGLSGKPLGPTELSNLHVNEKFSLFGTTLNLFRNIGSNIMLPEAWATKLTDDLNTSFRALKVDISDPRYTFLNYKYSLPGYTYQFTRVYPLPITFKGPYITEDTIGNPLHLFLFCLALISLLANRKRITNKNWPFYVICWFAMLVLFSGYLRWQLYGNRLLLPWFILAAPFTSVGIYYLFSFGIHALRTRQDDKNPFRLLLNKIFSPTLMLFLVASILVVCAAPLFYSNPTKPIWQDWNIFNLPRREVMLLNSDLLESYINTTDYLIKKDCHSIGLVGDGNEWEYPLWSLFRDKWGDSFRMENVLVKTFPRKSRSPISIRVPCW
jgi:hypothetical protein